MKRILLAGAALLALTAAQPTLAADAPVYKGPAPVAAAAYNWSGLYVGISGGWASMTTNWGDPAPVVTTGEFSNGSWILGGTIGVNWQTGPLVLGVEGDWSGTGLKATTSGSAAFPCGGAGGGCVMELQSLGTLRGRLGFATGSWMLYATGGWAFGHFRTQIIGIYNTTHDFNGWTGGGGVEAMLAPNWTAKAEYLYVAFGSSGPLAPCCGSAVDFTKTHIFRVGANYKFW